MTSMSETEVPPGRSRGNERGEEEEEGIAGGSSFTSPEGLSSSVSGGLLLRRLEKLKTDGLRSGKRYIAR